MKKIILGSLVLSGLLFACDKANVQDSPSGITSTNSTMLKANGFPSEPVFTQGRAPNKHCYEGGTNCSQLSTVGDQHLNIFETLVQTSTANLPTFFATHLDLFNHYFTHDMVEGLINGTLRLEIDGTFESGNTVYFSFFSGTDFILCIQLRK